jgi:hypothetical protein
VYDTSSLRSYKSLSVSAGMTLLRFRVGVPQSRPLRRQLKRWMWMVPCPTGRLVIAFHRLLSSFVNVTRDSRAGVLVDRLVELGRLRARASHRDLVVRSFTVCAMCNQVRTARPRILTLIRCCLLLFLYSNGARCSHERRWRGSAAAEISFCSVSRTRGSCEVLEHRYLLLYES